MEIAAIIPAFNEEATIKDVIQAVQSSPHISEVIVVDDGSSDKTGEIAESFNIKILQLIKNQGKGVAMDQGVRETDAPLLIFIDADLIGINSENLNNLIEPVLSGRKDMTVGAVDRRNFRRVICWLLEKTELPFSGTRVMKREFWEELPEKYKKKYYIESAITYFAKRKGLRIEKVLMEEVRHLVKEKKHGFFLGSVRRMRMFGQMILVNILLHLT